MPSKQMAAWEQALSERRITSAESQARLASTREDHWMNRQGDRLRQAIDRKMRFAPILLKMLGLWHGRIGAGALGDAEGPASGAEGPDMREKHPPRLSWNVL